MHQSLSTEKHILKPDAVTSSGFFISPQKTLPKPYYDENGITVYCGDCREIMPLLPQVHAVITDPPYGIGFQSGTPTEERKKDKIKEAEKRNSAAKSKDSVGIDDFFDGAAVHA